MPPTAKISAHGYRENQWHTDWVSEALDAAWYAAYDDLLPETPAYEVLADVPDIEGKKHRFVADKFAKNPDLRPNVDLAAIRERELGTLALQAKLTETEVEPVILEAYLPLLEGKLNGFKLQRAADASDKDTFLEATTETYGEPEKHIFKAITSYFRYFTLEQYHDTPFANVRRAARHALDALPDTRPPSVSRSPWPLPAEFADAKQLFAEFFDEMFEGVEIPDEVSGESVANIAEQVLINLGYDYEVIPQREGLSTMSVSGKKKQVKIPMKELYTRTRLRGLLGHEVRIHIEETQRGLQQPLKILGRGLRGSVIAGEGKGVLVEQIAYESWADFMNTPRFFDIARRHFSIGLARGLDGNGERDFKEVFKIVHGLDRLKQLAERPDQPELATARAIDKTWELLTQRTLKGVVGKGAAYFKDKVYAEGNARQWQLILGHPEVYPYLNQGHYDLTNDAHLRILRRIGTIPKQLLAE